MNNPFEVIEARLNNIETLLLDLKNKPKELVEIPKQFENFLTIQEAANFLNLTVPTIYSKVSNCELPVMKRSKRLYFSRIELMNYLQQGRKKTHAEIEQEAESYLLNNKKAAK